jgi:nicotinamidase-related amidase
MATPAKNPDLHGYAPDQSHIALLLIDVINDFEFEGAEPLFAAALPAARELAKLKQRAKAAGVPVVYVNDNFGRWQSDFGKLLQHCLEDDVRGRPIAQLLKPDEDDYFVLKPKHSGFYATTLSVLLDYLGTQLLVMGGFAMDACVLFTAADAFMRDKLIVIPSDGVAADSSEARQRGLEIATKVLDADVRKAADIDFDALKKRVGRK